MNSSNVGNTVVINKLFLLFYFDVVGHVDCRGDCWYLITTATKEVTKRHFSSDGSIPSISMTTMKLNADGEHEENVRTRKIYLFYSKRLEHRNENLPGLDPQ